MVPAMRRLLVIVVLVAAACSDTGSTTTVSPATTEGTTPPPTTAPSTSPPASTAGDTTTAPTTTTTVPPTTTAPLPTGVGVSTSSDCVLGWWDGAWNSTGDGAGPPPVDPGDALELAMLDGTSSAAAVELFPFDDIGSPAWSLLIDPEQSDGVAISGTWDAVPHLVELSSASQQVYLDQAALLLSQRGYPGVPIELAQVIRTDLEGDGVNEVIVSARHPGAPTYDRDVGVFSLVFLRRVIEGDVQTAILHFSVFAEEDVGQATSAEHAVVSAVADLNGDGTMEIAIDGSGYEWYWSEAFEYVDDDLGPVSVMLCGGGV